MSVGLCACAPATVKVWPTSGPPVANETGIVVQPGDSLYGIASRNGLTVADLAQANAIAEPFLIHPGDRLRLPAASTAKPSVTRAPVAPSAPSVRVEALPQAAATKPKPAATKPAAPAKAAASNATTSRPTSAADDNTTWRWPANGALVNAPARSDASAYALDIAGTAGSPVRAAAAGKVLYSGEGSPGHEQLVVIEHAGGWVSSYSRNRKRLVVEGQRVAAGAVIAEMGRTGARDMLHFELRRAGQLVDPRTVLPPR